MVKMTNRMDVVGLIMGREGKERKKALHEMMIFFIQERICLCIMYVYVHVHAYV